MSAFDVEELLREIDIDNPVGDDLEYDPDFIEMEELARSESDHGMIEGAEGGEAQSADWKGVRKKALDLLGRSKDLRTVVYLARSSAACEGVTGFRDSLSLLREMLERYWDTVHPRLDPDDDNDPTLRINTIAALCGKSSTLDVLAAAPLILSTKVGNFSYKDIQVANGEIAPPPDESSVPTNALISAACLDTELETLEATGAAVSDCLNSVTVIDQLLLDKVGSSRAPDLQPLVDTLNGVSRFMSDELVKRGVSSSEEGTRGDIVGDTGGSQSVTGEILSRADAMRMMDKVGNYYLAHEPSSPIPLLMQRAKRLSSMDFMSIIKELAPSGLSQAETIAGQGGSAGDSDAGSDE